MHGEKIAPVSEGKITDEALASWRERIGTKLRIGNVFNEWVTPDSLRHFANGVGDPNPLWQDEDYARRSVWGDLIAPPNFFYSVFPTWVLQGLPGVHAFHSGNDWTFYRPARLSDRIVPECIFKGFEEKPSKFAGRMVMEYQQANFYNQDGELLAKTDLWLVRAERSAARSVGKYRDIQLPHPWTQEELDRVEEEILGEEVRGANTRYWEDVQVGEELKPVVKGPFGLTDMIAYCIGAAPVQIMAHGMSLKLYRKHPAWGFRDPHTYALEPVYSVHYNKAAANAAGLPSTYDVGAQRQCWLIHLLTNWMGDDAWLKRNYAEYRRFVYFSDVVWFRGRVVRKYVDEDGEYAVDIETHGVNQRGEDTIPGHSTVVLPSRQGGTSPAKRGTGNG